MTIWRAATTAGLALALTACGGPETKPQPDRVREAIESLGGSPETISQQRILTRKPGSEQFINQIVFLVPGRDGSGFHIVDAYGETYDSYTDLLRENGFPQTPRQDG